MEGVAPLDPVGFFSGTTKPPLSRAYPACRLKWFRYGS